MVFSLKLNPFVGIDVGEKNVGIIESVVNQRNVKCGNLLKRHGINLRPAYHKNIARLVCHLHSLLERICHHEAGS